METKIIQEPKYRQCPKCKEQFLVNSKSEKKKDRVWNILLLIIGIFFIFITISAGLYGIERMVNYQSINEMDFWALISIVIFWKLGDLLKDTINKFIDVLK